MQDADHAAPAERQFGKRAHGGDLVGGIEGGDRLVEEQERRFHRQGAGEKDARFLAAGKLGHASAGDRFEVA